MIPLKKRLQNYKILRGTEIYGEKPSLAVLRAWLEKAVRIVVDSPKYGLGPKGTVGVIIADVDETKPV